MCRSSQIHMQILVSKTLLKGMEVPHISHTLTYWLNTPQRQKTKAQFPLCYRMQKPFCSREETLCYTALSQALWQRQWEVMQTNQLVSVAAEGGSPGLLCHRTTETLCEEALSLPPLRIRDSKHHTCSRYKTALSCRYLVQAPSYFFLAKGTAPDWATCPWGLIYTGFLRKTQGQSQKNYMAAMGN